MNLALPRCIQITDCTVVSEERLQAQLAGLAALPSALRAQFAVMVRDPQLAQREHFDFAERTCRLARDLGLGFWVNGRLDVARLLEADGVHLGRGALSTSAARALVPHARVSRSCHSLVELDGLFADGVDAIMVSPIFASPHKDHPLGMEALTMAHERCLANGVALIALGGIDERNARSVFDAGVQAVAAIRADLGSVLATLG